MPGLVLQGNDVSPVRSSRSARYPGAPLPVAGCDSRRKLCDTIQHPASVGVMGRRFLCMGCQVG